MRIGILGSGRVGGSLGALWARGGHEVCFGLRDPRGEQGHALLEQGGQRASAGTLAEAAAFGDAVIVALPWPALEEVLAELGGLNGKVVIDATNRLNGAANAPSAGEDLARLLPGARVVKAFNTIGAEHYADPDFGGEGATMLIAGDDPEAKNIVSGFARQLGFEPLDAGPLAQSAALEALASAWVGLSRTLGRDFAFQTVHKTPLPTSSP